MPSEPSCACAATDASGAVVSAEVELEEAASSRNVADGTKNSVPVLGVLKSSNRS